MKLTIEYRRGYWTICHNGKAIASMGSLFDAQLNAPEAQVVRPS